MNDNEMEILHICPGYLQRPLYDKFFMALCSKNVKNDVFALPFENIDYNADKPYNVKILNKRFTLFDRLIFFGKQRILYESICRYYSLQEYSKIHAHTLFSSGYSAYLINRKFGTGYIVTVRNTDINVFFRYVFYLRRVGRRILKNSRFVVFLSPSYRDLFINKYIPVKDRKDIFEKSVVIPNGIDSYFLNNKVNIKRVADIRSIKLIFIGEIKPNKNIETIIKACELLINEGYSVSLMIIGRIINDRYYKKTIPGRNYVTYQSKCPKEKVILYLRAADIFVMPSVTESFGLVYAEAMSQGLPVIYSKGQGFDGQFENGTVGYAVNCFDYRDIASKILSLYRNYQQFSERCVALVNKFNWLTIADKYKDLYKSR